jgi:hypothetical protein
MPSDRWQRSLRLACAQMADVVRCAWAESHPILREYHDHEYGRFELVPPRASARMSVVLATA